LQIIEDRILHKSMVWRLWSINRVIAMV